MDTEALSAHWLRATRALVPGLALFDAHTHIGANDPDGFSQSPQQLRETLLEAEAVGCFVFPMHEPEGYRAANDMVIELAAQADCGMVAFCRVAPGREAPAEARRALRRGARGIKLHPRAERFTLDHPEVRELFELADERSLPLLIHAGRGIPALGEHVVRLAARFPNAPVILAHAGVCDLAWIWRAARELPNLLFDSSWWIPADLSALMQLVPPGQILFASDAPYGRTALTAAAQVRLALQAGWSDAQVRAFSSEQSLRLAAGQPPLVAGAALGERDQPQRLLLARVGALIQSGIYALLRGGESAEALALAELACAVPDELDDAPLFNALRALLEAARGAEAPTPQRRGALGPLILALALSATPDVPLPLVALPDQA